MSRYFSTSTPSSKNQKAPAADRAVKHSYVHFKEPQVAAKPIGYFTRSGLQTTPSSVQSTSTISQTLPLSTLQSSDISQPVRHSYHSRAVAKSDPIVRYSYRSKSIVKPDVIASNQPLSIQIPKLPNKSIVDLLSYQVTSTGEKIKSYFKWLREAKYQHLTERLDKLRLTTSQKDLRSIEALLDHLIQVLHNSPTTKTLAQGTAHWFTQQTIAYRSKISSPSLSLLHRIQIILQSIAEKQTSTPTEDDISEFSSRVIRNLQGEKVSLQRKVAQLNQSHQKLEAEVSDYSSNLLKLTRQINDQSHSVNELHTWLQDRDLTIQSRNTELQSQLKHIESLREQINDLSNKATELAGQKNGLETDLLDRQASLEDYEDTIQQLKTELAKYDQIRILEGKYVGVPSSKGSKYHYHKKCPGWKMLVGEYMLNLDPTRAVLSSKDPDFFIKCGLTECLDCKNKSH